jgi:hypothetical protein
MQLLIKKIYEVFAANEALLTDVGLQPVRTVDLYRGQTVEPEKFEYFPTPAVFIQKYIRWSKEGKRYIGKTLLDFHFVSELHDQTANFFTDHEAAIAATNQAKIIHAILDDLQSEETSKLVREEDKDVDTGVVQYTIYSYSCQLYESASNTNTVEINGATIEVKGKLVKQL